MSKNIPILLCILAIACAFLYASRNMDTIMAMRAEYYFKKNDMVNAQKYYEKAFDHGLKETKARDIYVNSIINSPMNIDEQEKLVKFKEKVFEWYQKRRRENIFNIITSKDLKEQALLLSNDPFFMASNGWLSLFKKKYPSVYLEK